jgi:SET domain-containing protein
MPEKSLPAISVRRSVIHGRGVYATRLIKKGERIIEYKGERINWKEALRRHPHDPEQPNHTFYFTVGDDCVIDGGAKGNAARWINHSCNPNCEADMVEVKGQMHVFISALRDIKPGEELSYDYGLEIDGAYTAKLKREFACWCGHKECRGTMLAPKSKKAGKSAKR